MKYGIAFFLVIGAVSMFSIVNELDESEERSNRAYLMSSPTMESDEFTPED